MTEKQQKVATLPLTGPTFDCDNAKVYGIIKQLAKAPDKFKIPSAWKVFAEALETYLGQLLGFGE